MKILVIVDTQNDFISGSLGSPEAEAMIPRLVDYIKSCDLSYGSEMLALLTKDTHVDNYLETPEGKQLPVEHCITGTHGWSIDKRVSNEIKNSHFSMYSDHDIIQSRICKPTFGSIRLAEILKEVCGKYFVEEIIFTGLCTDICVVSNALLAKAYCPDTQISVKADCCAGTSVANHNAALAVMSSCQINII